MKPFIFTFMTLLLLGSRLAGFAADTPFAVLRYEGPFLLSGKAQKDTVYIPLKFTDEGDLQSMRINGQSTFVMMGKRMEKSATDAFTVIIDTPFARLQIIADMGRLRTQGNYDLVITLQSGTKKADLTIPFTRPSATLACDRSIKISVVDGEVDKASPFAIHESTKNAGVFQLRMPPVLVDSLNINGLVQFGDTAYNIPAGALTFINYTFDKTLASNLPFGISHGHLEISSPEMSGSLVVNFEITRSRTTWWIIISLFAGVLCGFLFRHYLKKRKELEEQRALGSGLILRIRGEIKPIKDQLYLTQTASRMAPLETLLLEKVNVIKGSSELTTRIAAGITTASDAYNAAKIIFMESCAAAQTELRKLSGLLDNPALPPEIRQHLTDAEAARKQGAADLADFNVSDAGTNMANARNNVNSFLSGFVKSVGNLISQWQGKALDLTSAPPILTQNISDRLSAVKKELDNIKTNETTTENVELNLKLVANIQVTLKETFQLWLTVMATEFNKAYDSSNTAPEMKDFESAFNGWKAMLEIVSGDPLQKMNPAVFTTLNKAWAAVTTLLAQAGVAVAQRLSHPGFSAGPYEWFQRNFDGTGINFVSRTFTSDPVEVVYRSARANWFLLTTIQSAFVLLILAVVAYQFYSPGFVGTWPEIFGIFAVAFSSDITIDNVFTYPKKA